MRTDITWKDRRRSMELRAAKGSRRLGRPHRRFKVQVAGEPNVHEVVFTGSPLRAVIARAE